MKLLLQILIFLKIGYLTSCSNTTKTNTEIININKPEIMYSEALKEFESENYDLAHEKFYEIELKFPLSKEAIQSQIMMAFVEYIKLDYDLNEIHPSKVDNHIFMQGAKWAEVKEKDFKQKIIKFREKSKIPIQWAKDLANELKKSHSQTEIEKIYHKIFGDRL